LTNPVGARYFGEWKAGARNGQGTMIYSDGRQYVGQFKDGTMDGTGKMTYPDGTVEQGMWQGDKFEGVLLSNTNKLWEGSSPSK
jgi:hypothetical protein